jgi:hypothetical protein
MKKNSEYDFHWSPIGRIFRKVLSRFGLALSKDFHYADNMWVLAINNSNWNLQQITDKREIKRWVELLYDIDKESLDIYLHDYSRKNKNSDKQNEFLSRVVPVINEVYEEKEIEKGL